MTLPRLHPATLDRLPRDVQRPAYQREATRIGIVHLGAGAFHRAHQAAYVDELLADEPDWAICAVSLRSTELRDALAPQHGLYTLVTMETRPSFRIIGAIRELLCARDQLPQVLARLTDPATRLVTLTITEKGYCLKNGELDLAHPDIAHDQAHPQSPRSAAGLLLAALSARQAAGVKPFSVLSCDNLPDNGGTLRRSLIRLAEGRDPQLVRWIEDEVAFPRSMVDSITPATDAALCEQVSAKLHVEDVWPVQREAFSQWVVEDRFCNDRPPLHRVGVVFSDDVDGFERAKLRLLNAAHSTLAYLGLLKGLDSVADAMCDTGLADFVATLMREDIAPTLSPVAGLDLTPYIESILQRFRNPAIRHRLSQIAWDGSQKLPLRLLPTLAAAHEADRSVDRLCLPIAAWFRFLIRQVREAIPIVDPHADTLTTLARRATGDRRNDLALLLPVLPELAPSLSEPAVREALDRQYRELAGAPWSNP